MRTESGGPGDGIVALYRAIWNGQYPKYAPEVRDEGLCITSIPVPRIGFEYREPPTYVFTRFSSELSWLITGLLAHLSSAASHLHEQQQLVRRLAVRARQYLLSGGLEDEDAKPLLIEVLDEACSILGEADKRALSSLHLRLGELARAHKL